MALLQLSCSCHRMRDRRQRSERSDGRCRVWSCVMWNESGRYKGPASRPVSGSRYGPGQWLRKT